MSKRIVSSETSHPEGSGFRETYHYDDGSHTDMTLENDKTWTVTDHEPDGSSKTFLGASDWLNTLSGVTRVGEEIKK